MESPILVSSVRKNLRSSASSDTYQLLPTLGVRYVSNLSLQINPTPLKSIEAGSNHRNKSSLQENWNEELEKSESDMDHFVLSHRICQVSLEYLLFYGYKSSIGTFLT